MTAEASRIQIVIEPLPEWSGFFYCKKIPDSKIRILRIDFRCPCWHYA